MPAALPLPRPLVPSGAWRQQGHERRLLQPPAQTPGDALRWRAETRMHCVKLLGQRLSARDFDRQVAEFQVRVAYRRASLRSAHSSQMSQDRSARRRERPTISRFVQQIPVILKKLLDRAERLGLSSTKINIANLPYYGVIARYVST